MAEKSINMPTQLKDSLRDAAWLKRITMSEIIREVIVDYAQERFTPASIETPAVEMVEIKYAPPPEYDLALARAKREGLALTEVIRRGIASRLAG